MTDEPRNSAPNTRGRPFEPGNPGKPKGARHKTTILAENLMAEDAEAIVKKVIEAAKNGDLTAARIVLDRIAPPGRDNPVSFDLPTLSTAAEASAAMGSILAAVASGELTPAEAAEVAKLIEGFTKTLELTEIERRLRALEERNGNAA
jgi:hypothetical protein